MHNSFFENANFAKKAFDNQMIEIVMSKIKKYEDSNYKIQKQLQQKFFPLKIIVTLTF